MLRLNIDRHFLKKNPKLKKNLNHTVYKNLYYILLLLFILCPTKLYIVLKKYFLKRIFIDVHLKIIKKF